MTEAQKRHYTRLDDLFSRVESGSGAYGNPDYKYAGSTKKRKKHSKKSIKTNVKEKVNVLIPRKKPKSQESVPRKPKKRPRLQCRKKGMVRVHAYCRKRPKNTNKKP